MSVPAYLPADELNFSAKMGTIVACPLLYQMQRGYLYGAAVINS